MAECRVQKLYEACRATFRGAGTVPPLEALQNVKSLLGEVTPTDLGLEVPPPEESRRGFGFFGLGDRVGRLSPFSSTRSQRFTPPIIYLNVHESENFTLAVFCLPSAATIPLHDHPGMVVLSKLLYGSLHVRAYDWDDKSKDTPDRKFAEHTVHPRPARMALDQVVAASDEPMSLFPESGNIHAFTALTPCAIFDILAPPYMPDQGRDCTYFCESNLMGERDVAGRGSFSRSPEEGITTLVRCTPPDDFVVRRGMYKGPLVE